MILTEKFSFPLKCQWMLAFENTRLKLLKLTFSKSDYQWMLSLFSYPSHAITPSETSHWNLLLDRFLQRARAFNTVKWKTRGLEKSSLAPMVLPPVLLHCTDVWRARAHENTGTLIRYIIQKLAGFLLSSVSDHHTLCHGWEVMSHTTLLQC